MKRLMLVLPLVLIVALAVMGVGYGLWYENLTIDGAVSTGTVSGQFVTELSPIGQSPNYCNDNENPSNITSGGPFPWKDIADLDVVVDSNDPRILHLTIDNGYPYYGGDCQFKYMSTGTVPVHVEDFSFDLNPTNTAANAQALTGCTVTGPTISAGGYTLEADCNELWIAVTDGLGSQLHEGVMKTGNIAILVKQPAEQGSVYKIDFNIQLNQYNESIWPITP